MTAPKGRLSVITHAFLRRDIPTPIGIFARGIGVSVIKRGLKESRVCLDTDCHLGRCHVITIPTRFIDTQRDVSVAA